MLFSNLLEMTGTFDRKDSFPLVLENCDNNPNSYVRLLDGKIYVSRNPQGVEIFKSNGEDDELPTPVTKPDSSIKDLVYQTYRDLKDTEDNPLIIVCTKSLRFYNEIPTYLDVLFVNSNMMLVMLVYGVCDFQFSDGSYVTLQRCCDISLNNRKVYSEDITCDKLKSYVQYKTKAGYDKSYDVVCPLYIRAYEKVDRHDFFVRFIKDNATFFNEEKIKKIEENEVKRFEEQRIAKEERDRILAEKKRKNAEISERKRQARELERERQLAVEKEIKEIEKRKSKKSKSDLPTGTESKRSLGAAVFLSMLNGDK